MSNKTKCDVVALHGDGSRSWYHTGMIVATAKPGEKAQHVSHDEWILNIARQLNPSVEITEDTTWTQVLRPRDCEFSDEEMEAAQTIVHDGWCVRHEWTDCETCNAIVKAECKHPDEKLKSACCKVELDEGMRNATDVCSACRKYVDHAECTVCDEEVEL